MTLAPSRDGNWLNCIEHSHVPGIPFPGFTAEPYRRNRPPDTRHLAPETLRRPLHDPFDGFVDGHASGIQQQRIGTFLQWRNRTPGIPCVAITQILQKMIEAGEGKLQQGDSEVLAWTGSGYKKANGNALLSRLQSSLQAQGWTYELGAKEGEITIFSASKARPAQRDVVGFFVPTDDALVMAWTEVMPANAASQTKEKSAPRTSSKSNPLLGTWDNGGMSLMGDRNRITGATTPSNGHTLKYVFTADGRFENIGMMQSTQYGCTTTLFNDKRGTYTINGSAVTLTPDKNFWRQQNSCAPNSTNERNYTLTPETYQMRTKTDEYGKPFICLANGKGETCYRRVEK